MAAADLAGLDAVTLARLVQKPRGLAGRDDRGGDRRDGAPRSRSSTPSAFPPSTRRARRPRDLETRLARGEDVGPLAGVPIGIKDLVLTKDLRTTFGSHLYADFVPDVDDVAVARLRAAGAIILGKTNAAEFGYGGFGHNPLFADDAQPLEHRR